MILTIKAKITKDIIPYSSAIQNLCKCPYLKHPKGCPNYGHKRSLNGIRKDLRSRVIRECPPTNYLIKDVFDFSKPLFIIYGKFKLGEFAEQMKQEHPKLKTIPMIYNLRYWQNNARKQLYAEVARFLDKHQDSIVDLCPEAHGVNLTKLMKNFDINLKWEYPPKKHNLKNITYLISLGGFAINQKP